MSNVKKLPQKQPKNLNDLISGLPSPNVSNQDLRELLLQFIQEIPPDAGDFAARTKVKLDAFGMLIKLNQLEQKQTGTLDLVSIINEGDNEDDE